MNANQNGFSELLRNFRKAGKHAAYPDRIIDIFGSVQRYKKILERLDTEALHYFTSIDIIREIFQDFLDRITGHKDPVAFDALANEIFFASLGIRQQN